MKVFNVTTKTTAYEQYVWNTYIEWFTPVIHKCVPTMAPKNKKPQTLVTRYNSTSHEKCFLNETTACRDGTVKNQPKERKKSEDRWFAHSIDLPLWYFTDAFQQS